MGRRTLAANPLAPSAPFLDGANALLASTVPRSSLLFLLLTAACARVDVRELIPAHAWSPSLPPLSPLQVAVAPSLLGTLPPPPSLAGGLTSLVPEPLGDLVGSLPLMASLTGQKENTRWMEDARRADVLTPRLVETLLGGPGVTLTGARPWWAFSDEASAMAAARAQGIAHVLVVKASVGPDDGGDPLPGHISASAEVALLDAITSETRARAYDRVSIAVRGGPQAMPATLRRAGGYLGERLRKQLGLGGNTPPTQAQDDNEE
jgi:hypothetical protein